MNMIQWLVMVFMAYWGKAEGALRPWVLFVQNFWDQNVVGVDKRVPILRDQSITLFRGKDQKGGVEMDPGLAATCSSLLLRFVEYAQLTYGDHLNHFGARFDPGDRGQMPMEVRREGNPIQIVYFADCRFCGRGMSFDFEGFRQTSKGS